MKFYLLVSVLFLILMGGFYLQAQENEANNNIYQKLDKAVANQKKIEEKIQEMEENLHLIWNMVARLSNR